LDLDAILGGVRQAQSVNVNFDAVRGGFVFLRGFACLTLQGFEQGGLADVAFADQHKFGFVERFGVLFETAEVGFDRVQTLFVCALQGGVEGIVVFKIFRKYPPNDFVILKIKFFQLF